MAKKIEKKLTPIEEKKVTDEFFEAADIVYKSFEPITETSENTGISEITEILFNKFSSGASGIEDIIIPDSYLEIVSDLDYASDNLYEVSIMYKKYYAKDLLNHFREHVNNYSNAGSEETSIKGYIKELLLLDKSIDRVLKATKERNFNPNDIEKVGKITEALKTLEDIGLISQKGIYSDIFVQSKIVINDTVETMAKDLVKRLENVKRVAKNIDFIEKTNTFFDLVQSKSQQRQHG